MEEVQKDKKRMRLWHSYETIVDHEITASDNDKITSEFLRKSEAVKENKQHSPDTTTDSYMSKQYYHEGFNFYEFSKKQECLDSLRCTQLRNQYFELLEYIRQQLEVIEELTKEYNEEQDPKTALCIREIIRKKKSNIEYLNNIRGGIADIFITGEDAAVHFERCWKILKRK